MANDDFIEQMANQAARLFKAPEIPPDLQENLRSLLQSGFSRLDLVSRDEFDAQAAVLARSRQKLEQLEQQIRELENALQQTAE